MLSKPEGPRLKTHWPRMAVLLRCHGGRFKQFSKCSSNSKIRTNFSMLMMMNEEDNNNAKYVFF